MPAPRRMAAARTTAKECDEYAASSQRTGPAAGPPRRTVRLRLTALYGALFLVSGAGLLTITNILARSWPWPRPAIATPVGSRVGRLCTVTQHPVCYSVAQLQAKAAAGHAAALNQLLAESAIALGVMTVVSVVLGWLVAGRVLRPLRER